VAKQEKTAADILKVVDALRPGVLVTLGEDEGKPLQVRVRDVALEDIEEFAAVIGSTIPQIITAISGFIRDEIATGGKFTWGDLQDHPEFLTEALAKPALIGRLVPLAIQSLSDMIDKCVEPNGVFKKLPHDMAAPVIRQWIELNLLDSGKLKGWGTAFSGLTKKLQEVLPASELSAVT